MVGMVDYLIKSKRNNFESTSWVPSTRTTMKSLEFCPLIVSIFQLYFYTLLFHSLFSRLNLITKRYRSFCSGRTLGALVSTIKFSKFRIILVIMLLLFSYCNLRNYLFMNQLRFNKNDKIK